MAQTFTIPTGPGGAQAPTTEAQFKSYWHDRFNADPRMQAIRDHPRMSEQSKANSGRALATDMGWIPPDNSWQIDFDKHEGMRTERDSYFTRHQLAITAAALGGVVGASAIAGAAGAGGAGAGAGSGAANVGGASGLTAGDLAAGGGAGAGAGAGGGAGAGAGGGAGTGGWLSRLGTFARGATGTGTTGGGLAEAGRVISGMASGRAAGRLTEEQIMALDANLRMNAAKTQADLYNEARRNSIRGKLMSEAPTDYAGMVPANVRAFSGTSPVDTSRNPALGKQLQDDAAGVLAKGPGSYDASSIPPPPYAGKGDTALNWLGTGLQLYGDLFGGGGAGGGSTAGLNPLSGAASAPADNAANVASQNDKISDVAIQPPSLPGIPGITLPPYTDSMPTDSNLMAGTTFRTPLDPFLPNNVYRVPRSGVRF